MIDYLALKTELLTDPSGLGYAASVSSGDDVTTAAVLNVARGAITIRRADINVQEFWNAIDVADFTALPGAPTVAQLSSERRFLAWLSGLAALQTVRLLNDDGTDTPVVTNLKAMFPAGSATRTRLLALAIRNGSRAEQLFGVDTIVGSQDIARALRG